MLGLINCQHPRCIGIYASYEYFIICRTPVVVTDDMATINGINSM